ncbi:hypothetical protein QL285_038416 [Trifolium repens]|nr:hypothetical protein QL285_038416 [Trifolium repens]
MKRATENDMHATVAGTPLLYSLQRVTYSLSEFRDLTAKLLCLMISASKLPSFSFHLLFPTFTKVNVKHAVPITEYIVI